MKIAVEVCFGLLIKKKRRERHNLKTNKRVSEVSLHIDVDAELDKALSFHQAGNLQQAEERYRKILKANPQHTDVLHLLGLVNYQSGKAELRLALLKKRSACRQNLLTFSVILEIFLGA